MSLSIDEILAADDLKPAEINVPQWGGTVFVRKLSALEAIRLSGELRKIDGDTSQSTQERLVVALATYLSNEQGQPLATIEQARAIAAKSAMAVNLIVEAGHRLNSVDTPAAENAAKN